MTPLANQEMQNNTTVDVKEPVPLAPILPAPLTQNNNDLGSIPAEFNMHDRMKCGEKFAFNEEDFEGLASLLMPNGRSLIREARLAEAAKHRYRPILPKSVLYDKESQSDVSAEDDVFGGKDLLDSFGAVENENWSTQSNSGVSVRRASLPDFPLESVVTSLAPFPTPSPSTSLQSGLKKSRPRRKSDPGPQFKKKFADPMLSFSIVERQAHRRQVHLDCEHRRRAGIAAAFCHLKCAIEKVQDSMPQLTFTPFTPEDMLTLENGIVPLYDATGLAVKDYEWIQGQVEVGRLSKQALLSTSVGVIESLEQILHDHKQSH